MEDKSLGVLIWPIVCILLGLWTIWRVATLGIDKAEQIGYEQGVKDVMYISDVCRGEIR